MNEWSVVCQLGLKSFSFDYTLHFIKFSNAYLQDNNTQAEQQENIKRSNQTKPNLAK